VVYKQVSEYSYIEDYKWDLGSDYDCELCGYTWNTLTLEFDNQYKDWSLYSRVGCYDGDKIQLGSDDSVEKFLDRLLQYEWFDIVMKADIMNKITKKEIEWGLV